MQKRKIVLLLVMLLSFFVWKASAQAIYKDCKQISVIQYLDTLNFAFLGGWNNPEFSNIDWNNDGIQDLYVFDRGTKLSYALVQDNNGEFHAEEKYLAHLPKGLTNWALMRDYNHDGIEDLFCFSQPSCASIYKGVRKSSNEIDFICIEKSLQYGSSSTTGGSIYIGLIDIPGIEDIDGDGDFDILAFNSMGTTIYYYKNIQVEQLGGFNQDTISYTLDKFCWGEIFDNNYPAVTENYPCSPALPSANTAIVKNLKHSGNTLALMDIDGDGDMDCLKGNITYNTLNMMSNTGTAAVAHIAGQDTTFPSYNMPLHCDAFPAGYFVDINNDQLLDLIASPNLEYAAENYHSSHLYLNTGTTTQAHFTFARDTFLIEEQMDFGESAFPVFEDIDKDGLSDLIVGSNGYYQANGNYKCGLAYYRNTGTLNNPCFTLISRDWQNFQSLNCKGMAPTFGDLDNDGDRDLICGTTDGKLNYFSCQANGSYLLTSAYYQGVDIGDNATPQLVDVDEDGLLDLLIGEKYGNVNYYKNTGTLSNPIFTIQTTNFGKVDVRENGNLTGFSTPYLCRLKQGDARTLLVGNESGHLQQYANIDNNLNGTFSLQAAHFSQLELGGPCSITGYNIAGVDTLEIAIGMFGGGMKICEWDKSSINSVNDFSTKPRINIYPNPCNINCTIHSSLSMDVINVLNSYGQSISTYSPYTNQFNLPTQNLSDGTYILIIRGKSFSEAKRLIVAH